MPTTPELLHAALKAQGIPAVGVSDKDGQMVVTYAPNATAQEMAAGAAIVANFNPNDPAVKEAQQEAAARVASESLMIKAFFRFFIYTTNGPDTVIDQKMIDEANALLARCFKEAAS